MNLEIYNSYCKLTGEIPPEVRSLVKQVLTYKNDIEGELGQLFYNLKRAKYSKDQGLSERIKAKIDFLKRNEWVCWFYNDIFPTGHLNLVKEAIRSLEIKYTEIDHRKVPTNSMILKWNNRPHPLRHYQSDMVKLGLKEGRGVFESAVGTGKSLVMAYLIKEISVVSLIVVPSKPLRKQLENDFTSWFGRAKVGVLDTNGVRSGKSLKPIRITTIQTLASLQKSGELHKVLGDVQALYIDETHHTGASSFTNLLPEIDHIYYRFGFTGTFLRNDSKSLDMWGFLSNVLYRYPPHKAIADGYLTPIEVNVYELEGIRATRYPKEYQKNYCGSNQLLQKVLEILEICGKAQSDEQVLILVKNKDKAGRIIHEFLDAYKMNNTYISGDDDEETIDSAISNFNDKNIRILIGSSVIGEGIDVKSTNHLIMCQGGKSEIVIVQAVGRAVRLFPGKVVAKIHDFDFLSTKYMKKHLNQRIDIYKRNFECKINRISS